MKRVLKWIAIALGVILVLGIAGLLYIYAASSRISGRTYDSPLVQVQVPSDSASLRRGGRLVHAWGCFSCHGEDGAGELMFEERFVGRAVAPNITAALPQYSDAELERLIRRGIKRDGKSVLIMPSEVYYHLSAADLGAIIAYLRAQPAREGPEGGVALGPIGRFALVRGEFRPAAAEVEREEAPVPAPDTTDAFAVGEYYAKVVCTLCHGESLAGAEDGSAPNLEIAAAYSLEQFERLLKTGVGLDGQEREMMTEMTEFTRYYTSREIAGLHAYLASLAPGDDSAPDPAPDRAPGTSPESTHGAIPDTASAEAP